MIKQIIVSSILFVCFTNCDYYAVKKQNAELQEKLNSVSMQEKCNKLAKEYFNEPQYEKTGWDYICHYNTKHRKFYMVVYDYDFKLSIITRIMVDLLEHKEVGSFMQRLGAKPWTNINIPEFDSNDSVNPANLTRTDWDRYENKCMTE